MATSDGDKEEKDAGYYRSRFVEYFSALDDVNLDDQKAVFNLVAECATCLEILGIDFRTLSKDLEKYENFNSRIIKTFARIGNFTQPDAEHHAAIRGFLRFLKKEGISCAELAQAFAGDSTEADNDLLEEIRKRDEIIAEYQAALASSEAEKKRLNIIFSRLRSKAGLQDMDPAELRQMMDSAKEGFSDTSPLLERIAAELSAISKLSTPPQKDGFFWSREQLRQVFQVLTITDRYQRIEGSINAQLSQVQDALNQYTSLQQEQVDAIARREKLLKEQEQNVDEELRQKRKKTDLDIQAAWSTARGEMDSYKKKERASVKKYIESVDQKRTELENLERRIVGRKEELEALEKRIPALQQEKEDEVVRCYREWAQNLEAREISLENRGEPVTFEVELEDLHVIHVLHLRSLPSKAEKYEVAIYTDIDNGRSGRSPGDVVNYLLENAIRAEEGANRYRPEVVEWDSLDDFTRQGFGLTIRAVGDLTSLQKFMQGDLANELAKVARNSVKGQTQSPQFKRRVTRNGVAISDGYTGALGLAYAQSFLNFAATALPRKPEDPAPKMANG